MARLRTIAIIRHSTRSCSLPTDLLESEVRHCKEHPRSKDPKFVPDFAARLEKEAKLAALDRRGKRGRTSVADRAATDIFGRDALTCWFGSNQYGC